MKKHQLENQNVAYVYSDIFTIGNYIIRQIMENFSKSQMAGSWELNLVLVINLSGIQKLWKHEIWGSWKSTTDQVVNCYIYILLNSIILVTYFNNQNKENFLQRLMVGSWRRNLAFVFDLSGTRKRLKHQLRCFLKDKTDWILKYHLLKIEVI